VKHDLAEKGWVPLRYWLVWWSVLGVALIVFYVLLTPIWMGLRALAWLAEQRSRAQKSIARVAQPKSAAPTGDPSSGS
jgi:hypothetical protein